MSKEQFAGIMLTDDPSHKDYKDALEALNFFVPLKSSRLKAAATAATGTNFNGVNKYGMVDLICFTSPTAKLTAVSELSLTAAMESLSNILVAAVLQKAGSDEQKQSAPDSWETGYNALIRLFCSNYSKNTTKYNDKVIGPEALKEVMRIGFDVDGEPEGELKTAIVNYLKNQGAIIDKMNYGSDMTNTYTLVGFSNFVKNNDHRCCFTAYFTTLGTKTAKISETCKDDKMEFDFSFEITRCNANFMLENWETNPAFRKRVIDFIDSHQPEDDYFNVFETGFKFRVSD